MLIAHRPGAIADLGSIARNIGFTRTLLVADPGLRGAGLIDRARDVLEASGISVDVFDAFGANPDSNTVEAGRAFAAPLGVDSIVALGGGSALDTAKGVNFLLTNGGRMADYRGYGRARHALLPSIGIPTTAGTGSDAQSYCVIVDADSHLKMACGTPSALFRAVILDPDLTATTPKSVRGAAAIDALAHVIETWVTTRQSAVSRLLSREAWALIAPAIVASIESSDDARVRSDMLLGAHLAGAAIEASMLGAAHACANPLTARYGTPHGVALGVLVPHVVRWNAEHDASLYDGLGGVDRVVSLVDAGVAAAGFPTSLAALGASRDDIPALAAMAATQWTGGFNPRAFDADAARVIYERAMRGST